MAKIRGRIPKESSGGYARVFDNEALGELMSKVHGTSISAGSELERLIQKYTKQADAKEKQPLQHCR